MDVLKGLKAMLLARVVHGAEDTRVSDEQASSDVAEEITSRLLGCTG